MSNEKRCGTCGGPESERYYSSNNGKSGWHQYVERIQDGGCPENCKPCPVHMQPKPAPEKENG